MDTLELVDAARVNLRQNLPVSALCALYAAASPCASSSAHCAIRAAFAVSETSAFIALSEVTFCMFQCCGSCELGGRSWPYLLLGLVSDELLRLRQHGIILGRTVFFCLAGLSLSAL